MARFCQGRMTRLLVVSTSLALAILPGQMADAQSSRQQVLAVRTASDFFDALDDGDIEKATELAADVVSDGLKKTIYTRKSQFGGRWAGDNRRDLVRVNEGTGEAVVVFHARYEKVTLEQTALVSCASRCIVKAFKEAPAEY